MGRWDLALDQWLIWPSSDFLVNMSASADVLAQAKVEIDLESIPEGKNVSMAEFIMAVNFLILRRSSSSGEASPSSSVTVPATRSRRPRAPSGSLFVIPRPMATVFRSRSG